MCDSRGVLQTEREITDPFKARFVRETDARTLADALVGADAFLGLSVGGLLSPEMVRSMAENPIVLSAAKELASGFEALDGDLAWTDERRSTADQDQRLGVLVDGQVKPLALKTVNLQPATLHESSKGLVLGCCAVCKSDNPPLLQTGCGCTGVHDSSKPWWNQK